CHLASLIQTYPRDGSGHDVHLRERRCLQVKFPVSRHGQAKQQAEQHAQGTTMSDQENRGSLGEIAKIMQERLQSLSELSQGFTAGRPKLESVVLPGGQD